MKEITLRDLNSPFTLTKSAKQVDFFPAENEDEIDENITETYKIYQDKINNNVVIYSYFSCDEEEVPNDIVASISDSIRDDAYNYLINVLNNSKNTVVYWSQVEGTTSDYIIYYDIKIPKVIDYNSIYNLTIELFEKNVLSYKYVEVKNGIHSKIEV